MGDGVGDGTRVGSKVQVGGSSDIAVGPAGKPVAESRGCGASPGIKPQADPIIITRTIIINRIDIFIEIL